MNGAKNQIVQGADDLLSVAVPGLLALGAAVPIFGVLAGLAGKFYVTYLEAGVNQLQFRELKDSVDYAVQQLATGSEVMRTIRFPKGHVLFVSLRKLAVSIYEASVYVKKFTAKYASMQARMGNTDMDQRELTYAQECISRAIDDFRQDLAAYAATVTLRNDQVNKLRELLVPPGFEALMQSHRANLRPDVYAATGAEPMGHFIDKAHAWLQGGRDGSASSLSSSAAADAAAASEDAILAVVGQVGMGKSMFATLLIDSIVLDDQNKKHQLKAAAKRPPAPSSEKGLTALAVPCTVPAIEFVPCFFFCRSRDPQRSTPAGLVRSLAFQVAHALPDMEGVVLEAARGTVGETDADELFEHLLLRPLTAYSEQHASEVQRLNLLFVVDGMDQMGRNSDADIEDRGRCLQFCAKKFRALPSWVRLVLTCTPGVLGFDDGVARGATVLTLSREDVDTAAELTAYTRSVFKELVVEPSELEAVVETVVSRAKGSFSYVLYALEDVHSSDSPRWTLAEVQTRLPLVYSNEHINKLMEHLRKKNPALFAQYQAKGLNLVSTVSDTLNEGMSRLGGMLSSLKAKVQ